MKMHKHDRSAIQSTAGGSSSTHREGVGAGDRVERVTALALRARRGEGVLLPAEAGRRVTRS